MSLRVYIQNVEPQHGVERVEQGEGPGQYAVYLATHSPLVCKLRLLLCSMQCGLGIEEPAVEQYSSRAAEAGSRSEQFLALCYLSHADALV